MSLPVDIYIRVSRRAGREDERFHSPEEQEQLARAYAERRGLDVGIVLPPDIDRSGGTVEREGLQRALERVRAGESQGIVVAWIDRFSRDAAQAYDLLRAFDDAGGHVYAPEAPEDISTPERGPQAEAVVALPSG
jgi:DNA invertase Pin-like site-specific DNA recombinase